MQDGLRHRLPVHPTAHPLLKAGDVFSFATGFAMTLLIVLFSIALGAISRLQRPLVTLVLLTIASVSLVVTQIRRKTESLKKPGSN